jgi:predicted lipoprotein with Yx(FWY)xxD motif
LAAGLAVVVAAGALGTGIALAAGTYGASSNITVGVKQTSLGPILYAGPKKLTVYMLSKDHGTKSACDSSATCVSFWPPVKSSVTPKAGAGVTAGALGTAKEGNFTQATYHGHLLYYFVSDKGASGVTGQLRNASGGTGGTPVWFALSANGAKVTKKASTGTTNTSTSTTTTSSGGGGGWA